MVSCSLLLSGLLASLVTAYEVPVSDADYSRQACSGMWANSQTHINVSFDSNSQGQLAMVIYEWADVKYLGNVTSYVADLPKTYICTSDALASGFCDQSQLGRFIFNLPPGKSINETSFWSAGVAFPESSGNNFTNGHNASISAGSGDFWNNPAGNPTPSGSEYDTPFLRRASGDSSPLNPSPSSLLLYTEPINYKVRKTGYYCVGVVPMTLVSSKMARQARPDASYHPSYKGIVLFKNTFDGKLQATDYPKVNFYFVMFLVYVAFGGAWGWLCYKNLQDLLPIQYYLSSLVGFVVVEMVANLAYYRYLNAHGKGRASTVFLFVVAILDAGRNALSFFMLLVVSLGLSVVRESLGTKMMRCQILAGAHFVFGVLYAVGIVELELESTSALLLLLFVVPLAFTLSAFLLWIMFALSTTMAQLRARKQRYKLSMFTKLHRILLGTVLVIAIFFVVSSLSFSSRLAEDYAANTWRVRWWLLDGWLALLYFAAFVSIAYLWRPSPNNRRLAMSDELAQDEEDAEDYDLEALERRTEARAMGGDDDDDDDATLVGRRGPSSLAEDGVVFEIGDEDEHGSDDEDINRKKPSSRHFQGGMDHEREELMGNGEADDRHGHGQ